MKHFPSMVFLSMGHAHAIFYLLFNIILSKKKNCHEFYFLYLTMSVFNGNLRAFNSYSEASKLHNAYFVGHALYFILS